MSPPISIVSIIGETCITIEDGNRIYSAIHPLLFNNKDVTLDFNGVKIFASPFFNAAIGQLLRDITITHIHTHLQIVCLSANGEHIFNRVIENAQRYYTNSNFRDSVEKVLAQQTIDL